MLASFNRGFKPFLRYYTIQRQITLVTVGEHTFNNCRKQKDMFYERFVYPGLFINNGYKLLNQYTAYDNSLTEYIFQVKEEDLADFELGYKQVLDNIRERVLEEMRQKEKETRE